MLYAFNVKSLYFLIRIFDKFRKKNGMLLYQLHQQEENTRKLMCIILIHEKQCKRFFKFP